MKLAFSIATLMLAAVSAHAQTAATTVQRNINQETRIEQGLQSGALSTQEAAKLQRQEARVDHMQANALKDGKLTDAEKARLNAAQNKVSKDIYGAKHNATTGNPDSASSKRMQANVQRNIRQEQRVENGIRNGSLTNREVAKLERGQARVARQEARAGADGHVGAAEQARVQRTENRQSKRIYKEKHDAQNRGS